MDRHIKFLIEPIGTTTLVVKPYEHDFRTFVQGYISSDISTKHTAPIYMLGKLPNLPLYRQMMKSSWTIIFKTPTWIIPFLWMLPIGHLVKGCDGIVGVGLSLVELGFSQLLLISKIKIMFFRRGYYTYALTLVLKLLLLYPTPHCFEF